MRDRAVRVVKVGGSLLDLPNLRATLRGWFEAQSPARNVLIAGGGQWADGVRAAAARDEVDDTTAHRLCIAAMGVTARLLAAILEDVPVGGRIADVKRDSKAGGSASTVVFDVGHFINHIEPNRPGQKLPAGWHVTGDSIAGRVAVVLDADELVLLKSASCPMSASPKESASAGFVDEFFPTIAKELPVTRCVNLRVAHGPETRWQGRAALVQ